MMLIKSKYLDRIFSLALPSSTKVDFMSVTVKDLQNVTVKFKHKITRTGIVHGYALYFDAIFKGSNPKN
jgi:hypothetical protein